MLLLLIFQTQTGPGSAGETTTQVFAVLYEQYLPKVFRFVRYRIEDNDAAEDITSTVFEKALTKFHTFRADRATFSTWIFAIARNTVIDYMRVSHRDEQTSFDGQEQIPHDDPSPEEKAVKAEQYDKLQDCVLRLSEPEQRIISLKFGAEMNNREIAKVLGISESNVANTLFRAVRKLRDSFGRWQDE